MGKIFQLNQTEQCVFLQITSIGFQNKAMGANIALSNAMASTTKTMADMNRVMNPEGISKNMRDFQQANMKMEMTDEMSKCSSIESNFMK